MEIKYTDNSIEIRISKYDLESVERVYLERFKDSVIEPIYDSFNHLIGIGIGIKINDIDRESD